MYMVNGNAFKKIFWYRFNKHKNLIKLRYDGLIFEAIYLSSVLSKRN